VTIGLAWNWLSFIPLATTNDPTGALLGAEEVRQLLEQ